MLYSIFEEERKQLVDSIQSNSTILIEGDSGIGKTSIVTSVLKEYDINFKFYDSISYKNNKIIDEMLNVNYNNMLQKLNKNLKIKKQALLIDNIDHISLMNEKQIITNLIEYNMRNKKFIIVCICNFSDNSNKFLIEIKKMSVNIKFHPLNDTEMHEMLLMNLKEHNIKMTNKKCIQLLLNFINSDLRKMDMIINDLKKMFNRQDINITKLGKYLETTNEKQCSLNSFSAIKEIIYQYDDVSKIIDIYNSNKVLIPLIFHENYYKDIFNRKYNNTQSSQLIKTISNYMSYGDIIETNIYTDQNWHLQNMHSFISCTCSTYFLNKHKQYKSKQEMNYEITFSSELNKTSLKNINRKNISNISLTNSNNLYDFLLMGTFINEMLNEEKYDQLRTHLSSYKLDNKTWSKPFETLLKIDKTYSNAVPITTKVKKMIF